MKMVDTVLKEGNGRTDVKKSKPEKKKYREGAVYVREGGKYIDIGMEFRGFPSDGIFLVQDGRSNMTCLIGSKESVPIFALNYRLHQNDLCRKIQETIKKQNGMISLMDEAKVACDFFAKKAELFVLKKERKK